MDQTFYFASINGNNLITCNRFERNIGLKSIRRVIKTEQVRCNSEDERERGVELTMTCPPVSPILLCVQNRLCRRGSVLLLREAKIRLFRLMTAPVIRCSVYSNRSAPVARALSCCSSSKPKQRLIAPPPSYGYPISAIGNFHQSLDLSQHKGGTTISPSLMPLMLFIWRLSPIHTLAL